MDASIFTSVVACEQIADRRVRELDNPGQQICHILTRVMKPFLHELRGLKTRRGATKDICRRICKNLIEEESVVQIVASSLHQGFSTKEAHEIRCIMVASKEKEKSFEFFAITVTIDRKKTTVDVVSTDFEVHRHALLRFMQREQKGPKEFFNIAVESMQVANVLAPVICDMSNHNIALPAADALMLGKIEVSSFIVAPLGFRMTFGNTKPEFTDIRRSSITENHVITRILTYVDRDGMTRPREQLHTKLCSFVDTHAETIETVFGRSVFNGLPGEEEPLHSCFEDAITLLGGPEWKQFLQTARGGVHATLD